MKRDFLKLSDLTAHEYNALFKRTQELKAARHERRDRPTLAGRTIALLFEKNSTRTRISFEAAMCQLGGQALPLPLHESQLSRGEPLDDTARVLSSYVDGIVMRTFGDDRLHTVARASRVPVINGLSDGGHPVQLLADLFTVIEHFGSLRKRRVAFIGDGAANMARSWVEAADLFDFSLHVASPKPYQATADSSHVIVSNDPQAAAGGAEVVVTDVWTSMGQESDQKQRRQDFDGFCVNEALLSAADGKAIVLHCLPAHRGEEISEGVLLGPQSAVFQEAENRLHTQKALLELLLAGRN